LAAIESAEGVLNAREIAKASTRLIGIAFRRGRLRNQHENKIATLTDKNYSSQEAIFIHSARAAGIAAIDTVYSDVENVGGFAREVELVKQLGFDGKSVINPRQIPIVNHIYAPTEQEIQHAKEVIWAIREAEEKGSGVISLKGKMVDKPIV